MSSTRLARTSTARSSDMEHKAYPSDPRFVVFEDGSVIGPRGGRTFGSKWPNGRLLVTTTLNGKKRSYHVARMVLEAFIGSCPIGCTASHLNGEPSDNRLVNLKWEKHSDNCARKKEHGTHQSGEKNPAAKLTEQDIDYIRRSKLSSRQIAPLYNVDAGHIRRIRQGRLWQ